MDCNKPHGAVDSGAVLGKTSGVDVDASYIKCLACKLAGYKLEGLIMLHDQFVL